MKNVPMRSILTSILLTALAAHAHAFSQHDADSLAKSLQEDIKIESVDGVLSKFTSDWVMVKEYDSSTSGYDYASYKQFLGEAFRVMSNYQYKVLSVGTPQSLGQNAHKVALTIKEMYFVGGNYVKEVHDQTWYVRQEGGEYLVSKVVIHN